MYLERFAEKHEMDAPVRSWAVGPKGRTWLSDGVRIETTDGNERFSILNVTTLAWADGNLWAGTKLSIMRLGDSRVLEEHPIDDEVVAFFGGDAGFLALTRQGLYRRQDAGWRAVAVPSGVAFVDGALDVHGRVWLLASDALYCLNGGDARRVTFADGAEAERWCSYKPPVGFPASAELRAIVADPAGHLWIGTSNGLLIHDGHEGWFPIRGTEGLPIEDVTHLAIDGTDLWVGTPEGVCLWTDGRWEYYAGGRWLPNDAVTALAAQRRSAWVGTESGWARLERRPYSLEAKAALMEAQVHARHNRHHYVTICILDKPGDLSSIRHEASDNDGLWTALYVAAESYRYAVTGSEEARENARRSMEALLFLEEITPIPGFPARAVMKIGEEHVVQSGGEWHESADGEWLWKADTSSDEVDGHFYALSIYYDLVADEAERERIAATIHRIMTHIIDHGYYLIDLDGERTRWGVWAPERLNGDWKPQQGLNSLEILSYLKAAHHMTGDAHFQSEYEQLVREHHYALNTIDQKLLDPGWVNHSDDELAFCAYYPLLKYETDPHLRRIYLASLERSWQIERPERCPVWNFIYGALTGEPCDVEGAVRTLQEIPVDLIHWPMRNSHRADVRAKTPPDGWNEELDPVILPYFERPTHKWNGNPYRLDGGSGHVEEDGTVFLWPYWLGRYYGFIPGEA